VLPPDFTNFDGKPLALDERGRLVERKD